MDPSGNATVVWQGVSGADYGIVAAESETGGGWSEPEPVSPLGEGDSEPSAAVDQTGEALVLWRSRCEYRRKDEGEVKVAAKPLGGSWSAPQSISPAGRKPLSPALAVDSAGEATAAWRYQDDRIVATYRPAGGGWGEPVPISGETANSSQPVLAVNGNGGAVAAWTTQNGQGEVVQAALRPLGRGWQPASTISPAMQLPGLSLPILTMDREGNVIAAWTSFIGSEKRKTQAAEYLTAAQPLAGPNLLRINTCERAEPRNSDNTPKIFGSAPTGSVVSLYTNSTCTGPPTATGTVAVLETTGYNGGIEVKVRDDTTTDFYATATLAGETSACSAPITYTEQSSTIGMPEALAAMPALDAFTTPEDPLSDEGAFAAIRGGAGAGFVDTGGWGSLQTFPTAEGAYWARSELLDTGTGTAVSGRLLAAPGAPSKPHFSLWLGMPKPATNKSGYELRFTQTSTATCTAALTSWTNSATTSLVTMENVALPVGSSFALVDRNSTLSMWAETGTGYAELASAPAANWDGGYAGVLTNGTGTRLRRFAAEALPVVSP